MSLIFEALKKLDREKQAPERGFLVVGASGWAAGRRARVLPIAAALAAAGVLGFLAAQWAQRPKAETTSAPVATSRPAAAGAAPASAAPASVPPQAAPPATYLPPAMPAVSRPAPLAVAQGTAEHAQARAAEAVPAAGEPAPAAVEPTYVLQAVTQQDGQPVAIVNGQLVRVGDTVEGAQVLRIDAQLIELQKDGRRIVVSF